MHWFWRFRPSQIWKVYWSMKRRPKHILSIYKRGPIQPCLGHEVSATRRVIFQIFSQPCVYDVPMCFIDS
jgi:hypothetical protein